MKTEDAPELEFEVAYARPDVQSILRVTGPEGMTAEQAIRRSGILERFPEIDLDTADVGIFGKLAAKDTELRFGDRVEIYRPLIADPKEARRRRAAQGKSMRKGGTGSSATSSDD